MYRVHMTRAAEADVLGIEEWYRELSPALVTRFINIFERLVIHIGENPYLFTSLEEKARRAHFPKTFPYSLFFQIKGDTIVIFACLHNRRNPLIWQNRKR